MGQYQINFACGCEETKQIYGKIVDRQKKADWLETQDCYECQRKAEQKQAQKSAVEQGLPSLEGSDKQIAWAEMIRQEHLEINKYSFAKVAEKGNSEHLRLVEAYRNETSAKWWIDNRMNAQNALAAMAKRIGFKK